MSNPFIKATDAQIWADFRNSGYLPLREATCCQALRILRSMGMQHLCYYHGKDRFEVAKINFCPECGRKL